MTDIVLGVYLKHIQDMLYNMTKKYIQNNPEAYQRVIAEDDALPIKPSLLTKKPLSPESQIELRQEVKEMYRIKKRF